MHMKTVKLSFILLFLALLAQGQSYFRSGIFLHHSTGQNIWGPNGSATSIPHEMDLYNIAHGFSGSEAVSMAKEWWSPSDNEWARWHTFFEDSNPATGIGQYLGDNPIVVIKSCFPSSAIAWPGVPHDTLDPEMKTVYNYKWHWRHIINVMKQHPENFLAIWTNAPLEPNSTNADEAALSRWFCAWATDTLALGLDPEFGAFPPNVYVFDFFHKLTGPNGMMLPMYAAGPGDSHPNAAATALVAPQFVTEIFDAAIGYEIIYRLPGQPDNGSLSLSVYPNPVKTQTMFKFSLRDPRNAVLTLFDPLGKEPRTLWQGHVPGRYSVKLNTNSIPTGIYLVVLQDGLTVVTTKLVVAP
ncbi:MAG: T9SS type A sorting domain-containing protein [Alphaproteobacteria bacterium]|nr:T9SS type A sorting domain-containing protein [Alphaproteobacteria bacterium]